MRIAASSLSANASASRACEAWVSVTPGLSSNREVRSRVGGAEVVSTFHGGISMRAIKSFIDGTADVAQANRLESVGQIASAEGVKATHALECGARFWRPSSLGSASVV